VADPVPEEAPEIGSIGPFSDMAGRVRALVDEFGAAAVVAVIAEHAAPVIVLLTEIRELIEGAAHDPEVVLDYVDAFQFGVVGGGRVGVTELPPVNDCTEFREFAESFITPGR
jgi:hypothetical protein